MDNLANKEFKKYKYECLGKVVFDDTKYMQVRGLLQIVYGLITCRTNAIGEDLEEIEEAITGIKTQIDVIIDSPN